jgi:tetratricopeptide (TPR) repeat protein
MTDDLSDRQEIVSRQVALLNALGRFDEAMQLLEWAQFRPWEGETSARALYVDAIVGRARKHLDDEDLEAAKADCQRSLEYTDNIGLGRPAPGRTKDAKGRYWLGTVLAMLEQPDASAAEFRQAALETHTTPSEGRYWQLLSLAALGEDTTEAAVEFYEKAKAAATQNPDDPLAQFALGLGAALRREPFEALETFRKTVELDPQHAECHRQLEDIRRRDRENKPA